MSFTKLCTIAVSLVATLSPVIAKETATTPSSATKTVTSKGKTTLKKATSKVKTTKDSAKEKVKASASSTKDATKTATSKAKAQTKKATTGSAISTPDKKTLEGMKKSASSLSATQSKTMLKTLNSGTNAELTALPGIGEKTAVSIKSARPFKDVTDLGNIKGIGAKKFAGVVSHFKK